MKRMQMLIPLMFILMLVSTTTPVLAAKEKTEKTEYTLPGSIWDQNKGMYGTISLTFSGVIKGNPDYEKKDSWEGPIDYSGDIYYEEYWSEGTFDWKAEVYYWYHGTGWEEYSSYTAKWYSPQPTYNGKLVAIWNDGSTATFSVGLSPLWIEKMFEEGTGTIDYAYGYERLIYWWDTENELWVYDRTETVSDSFSASGSYAVSMLSIEFTGKIQCKGRPPIHGVLSLEDYKVMYTDWKYSTISVSGMLGPYEIFGGPSIIPV